jgi:hypothetical protein
MEVNSGIATFRITKTSPVGEIRSPRPREYVDSSLCQKNIQIGIFFDGTGNNIRLHKIKNGHSNVARLYETYPNLPAEGQYSIYVPGLGTPFSLIGEETERYYGAAFADGGDSRVVFAILRIVDIINQTLFNTILFTPPILRALCHGTPGVIEKKFLQNLALETSLVDGGGRVQTKKYVQVCLNNILARMKKTTTPKICEISIDVFGFSRGATQARVFCHWINDALQNSKLANIPFRFRFLGLMDTVASVGMWEGIKNDRSGSTGGHAKWATADVMKILPSVENCVHLIAMHELRKNFPLDTVSDGNVLPSNCIEFCYPGSHSDVGGGYEPGELGVSPKDSEKLSQIPLNHMFDCAVAGGVPLSKELLGKHGAEAFIIDKKLLQDNEKFLDRLTDTPRSLGKWMLPYLAWRWQTMLSYHKNKHFINANEEDKKLLMAGNVSFCIGDDLIKNYEISSRIPNRKERRYDREHTQATTLALEPEAPQLRKMLASYPKIDSDLALFFDNYIHDSMSGFRKQFIENTGHWRYRRVFSGSEIPLIG